MGHSIELLKDLAQAKLREDHPHVPEHAIPRPKYSDKNSNGLTRCILDWITLNGFEAELITSTGRIRDKTKIVIDTVGRARHVGSYEWIKGTGEIGTADISATILGRSVKIEVNCKAATLDQYQTQKQLIYQKEIEASEGIYILARKFAGFMEWYQEFISENQINE